MLRSPRARAGSARMLPAARSPRRLALYLAIAALALPGGACALARRRASEPLVDLRDIVPEVVVDIRYAQPRNFTHQVLYPANRCLLRATVARQLSLVQSDLALQGLRLKVWDCYRPLSIQRKLWELVPDPRYVADPKQGSRHNRGAAVDATLVDPAGRELEMPTDFDDFSPKAHRDAVTATPVALRNRELLETVMTGHGFAGLKTEWWHFDAKGWKEYPILDDPITPR